LLKKLIIIPIIVALAAFFFLQNREKPQSKEIVPREIAPKVEKRAVVGVEEIRVGSVHKGYTAVGSIAPEDKARIMPKVSGRIAVLDVEEGDSVRQGDRLMLIDTFDYSRALENAVAVEKQSKANLEKAERDYLRMKRLYGDKTVSEQRYRDTKTGYELAQYAYEQAVIAHKTAERNLKECVISAPIPGIIASRHVNEGELVGPQTLAFVIMQIDKIKVEVDFPENAYSHMATGHACKITVDALPQDQCEGNIIRVNPTINPLSRTVKVTIGLDNPGLKLRPGMTARTEVIQTARTNVLMVPKSAILKGEEGWLVYRISGDTVEKASVGLGVEGDNAFEVTDGLSAGDQVVTKGLTGLRDGMPIRIGSS